MDWFKIKSHIKNYNNDIYDNNCSYCNFEYTLHVFLNPFYILKCIQWKLKVKIESSKCMWLLQWDVM